MIESGRRAGGVLRFLPQLVIVGVEIERAMSILTKSTRALGLVSSREQTPTMRSAAPVGHRWLASSATQVVFVAPIGRSIPEDEGDTNGRT